MRGRKRLLIAVTVLLFLFFLLLLVSSRLTILRSFEKIEEERIVRNYARVMDALSARLDGLYRQARDYAEWDETYRFSVNHDPEYVRSNLPANTFATLNLSLFLVIGPDGTLVYGRKFDPSTQLLSEVPAEVLSYFRSAQGREVLRRGAAGLLRLPGGVLELAVRPILTSRGKGPSRGAVIMGRYLDQVETAEIGNITHLAVTLSAPEQGVSLPAWQPGRPSVRKPLLGSKDDKITARGCVLGLDGTPAIVVGVEIQRDSFARGRQAVIYFICVIMATCIAFSLGGYFLYGKLTASRRESQASEFRYQSLFDHAPVALWEEDYSAVKRYLDGLRTSGITDVGRYFRDNPRALRHCSSLVQVIAVNQAALALYHACSKEELCRRMAEIFTDCSRELFLRVVELMARGGTFLAGEDVKATLTGETIQVYMTWAVAPGFEMSYGRIYVSDMDITQRKCLEEQLRHAQKMEAVGQLAGGIAHDFNNILTVIIGFTHLLQSGSGREDLMAEYRRQILAAAERAANLTQGLLAFSRRQVISLQSLELNELIRGFSSLLKRLIGEDVELVMDLCPESLPVRADRGQLEQVLMNFAANARDAMPRGGTLRIGTKCAPAGSEHVRGEESSAADSYACMVVSDTGSGMDAETRERIFEPFFTTKEVGKGTGLGLSIVYGVVKQHNGMVTVDSTPGQGTSFRVFLPLLPQVTGDTVLPSTSEASDGTETILLAEDDVAVRGYLFRLLEGSGYRVVAAGDGEEALAALAAAVEPVHLVILDVVMPKKNGREVYDVLRSIQPNLPILFISGYPQEIISRNGIAEQGIHLVTKPVKPTELLAKVRDLLGCPNSCVSR